MEDIVIVKKGVEPLIYYPHTCSQCDAVLDIKSTIVNFECPECQSAETCLQDHKTMKKVYVKNSGLKSMPSARELKKGKGKK
jgi:predicted RNA-binding Zn-ribbon protein involved in translation (DUF1610 family)